MKKVCMIVPSFEAKGGIAAVASGYPGSALEKDFRMRYIETYCDGSKGKKLVKAMGAYLKFIKMLLTDKPDLIHVHSAFGASFYRKALFIYLADLLGIPVVIHVHCSQMGPFYFGAPEYRQKFIRRTFAGCAKTVALSDRLKDELSQIVPKENIEVITNYGMLRSDLTTGALDRGGSILFLGFLSALKGCLDIPKIAAQVKQKIENVCFVLGGTGTDDEVAAIREQAKNLGVDENIVMPGWVGGKKKDSLLRKADVFLLPSYTEALPVSILEAMGYGLPVISTTVGGIPQLVEHGVNGYLYAPGDVNGFADGIFRLLRDPELRSQMGKAGYKMVKENFSFDAHVGKIIRLYREVLFEEES